MTRQIVAVVAALALLTVTATGGLAAGNVIHYHYLDYEESSMELGDDLAACVGYSGTLNEERTYDLRVTEFVGGPRAGEVQLNGFVTGPIAIVPDDPDAGPLYTGTMREKIVFRGAGFDDPQVFTFVVHANLSGSDGSRLKITYHGHGVFDRDGEPKTYFDRLGCVS